MSLLGKYSHSLMAPTRKRSKGKKKTKKRLWGGTSSKKRSSVNNLENRMVKLRVSENRSRHSPNKAAASSAAANRAANRAANEERRTRVVREIQNIDEEIQKITGTYVGTNEVHRQNVGIMKEVAKALAKKHMRMSFEDFIHDQSVRHYIRLPSNEEQYRTEQFKNPEENLEPLRTVYEHLCTLEEKKTRLEQHTGDNTTPKNITDLKNLGSKSGIGNMPSIPVILTILAPYHTYNKPKPVSPYTGPYTRTPLIGPEEGNTPPPSVSRKGRSFFGLF